MQRSCQTSCFARIFQGLPRNARIPNLKQALNNQALDCATAQVQLLCQSAPGIPLQMNATALAQDSDAVTDGTFGAMPGEYVIHDEATGERISIIVGDTTN
jgi:hypothetical protein